MDKFDAPTFGFSHILAYFVMSFIINFEPLVTIGLGLALCLAFINMMLRDE